MVHASGVRKHTFICSCFKSSHNKKASLARECWIIEKTNDENCTVPVVSSGGSLSTDLSLCLFSYWARLWPTFPYVSFMGQTVANHSYVDLRTVGNDTDNSDSVVCHADLDTCCVLDLTMETDGTRLSFSGPSVPIGAGRTAQCVICRITATGPTGLSVWYSNKSCP